MELVDVLEILKTAADEAAGPVVPVSLSPFTEVLFLIPKYKCVLELGLSPVHVTVACWTLGPWVLSWVGVTAQLPPPGGLYVGPPLMVSAAALEVAPYTASTPKVATSFLVHLRWARRSEFDATLSAVDLLASG